MSKQPIKFSEYPLVVPDAKKLAKKMEKFVTDLKACDNAKAAIKVINRINAYSMKSNNILITSLLS